jgi:ABC-type Zn uptake system ZnuABC Zn-binding protein ZnuA
MSVPRRRLHHFVPLAGALAGAVLAAGCGSSSQAVPAGTPPLTVATAAFPLQQMVSAIGQGHAAVVNLAPPGTNPAALTLTSTQLDQVHEAGLVVEVSRAYQPALGQAATGQEKVVSASDAAGGGSPEIWLDPSRLAKAVPSIAAAMERADPTLKSTFANGARDFLAELQSVEIDYQETLSDCATRAIVTPDGAFRATASQFGFTDVVVGATDKPTPAAVAQAAAAIRSSGATTAFTEPWVPSGLVVAAAAQAHVKVKSLDTLTGPPPKGWPSGATYFGLIEQDLGTLKSALQCAEMEDQ